MKIGIMNFPAADIFEEIEWASKNKFDFVDITLEPPLAYYDALNPVSVRSALKKAGISAVGHTAYYFPIGSPMKTMRAAAVKELVKCADFFAKIGVRKMNIHPDFNQPHFFNKDKRLEFNIESLKKITAHGEKTGVEIMIENMNSDIDCLAPVFSAIPELKFHCDVGHANLLPGNCDIDAVLKKFPGRLRHVHLSDNKGGYGDLHIPLGAGTIDWNKVGMALKDIGYDDTVTLEVFSPDRKYLTYSRDKFKKIWAGLAGAPKRAKKDSL